MILSRRHKFVFVKGHKVGGTSAEIALSQICGPDDVVTPITPADERYRLGSDGEPRNYASSLYPSFVRRALERRYVSRIREAAAEDLPRIRHPWARFQNHQPLKSVLRLAPEAADYTCICVERSPYSKVMSLANWEASRAAYAKGEELDRSTSAIADAVDRLLATGEIRGVLNIDQYRDSSGAVRATAWKTGTLADDVAKFIRSLGCEPPQLVHAKKGLGSDSVDPKAVLRADQIESINTIFAEEFSHFDWPTLN